MHNLCVSHKLLYIVIGKCVEKSQSNRKIATIQPRSCRYGNKYLNKLVLFHEAIHLAQSTLDTIILMLLLTGCDNHITGQSGVIMSQYYPNSYPSSSQCSWTVEVDRFYQISLESIDLNIGTEDTNAECFIKVCTCCNICFFTFTLFLPVYILKKIESIVSLGCKMFLRRTHESMYLILVIRITCPCNLYPFTSHFYIVKQGCTGVIIIFLFLL